MKSKLMKASEIKLGKMILWWGWKLELCIVFKKGSIDSLLAALLSYRMGVSVVEVSYLPSSNVYTFGFMSKESLVKVSILWMAHDTGYRTLTEHERGKSKGSSLSGNNILSKCFICNI